MRYNVLVGVYEALSKTTKRLEKTEIISGFLKKADERELEDVVYLLLGRVFGKGDARKIGFSSRLMLKAVGLASGVAVGEVEKKLAKVGDLGKIAENVLERKGQATLFNKKLDVEHVLENIRKLSTLEGEGTVNKKISLVVELLSNADALEARYIVNTILENLRIGISDGVIRDAIASAYNLEVKEVEHSASLIGDYAGVVLLAKKGKLGNVGLKVGRPVKCMLSVVASDINEAFEALGKPCQFEVKIDGFRLQCHCDDGKYWLYTRRMEIVNNQFPDVIEILKKQVKARSYIIDAEAVGYDVKTGRYLPFQAISQRIKRKHNVHEMAARFPVELDVFDVLYCDGENLMNIGLKERRKVLEGMIKEKKKEIILTRKLVTDDNDDAEGFFKKAIEDGYEGVMIKNLSSQYIPGRYVNGWMKLKQVLEPLDLVIVKAEYGEGKRAGWLTSFTIACRSGGELREVGKVSTGVKEKAEGLTYKELTAMLKPLIIHQQGKEVIVKARVILEVAYEEIQKSPSYSSGYALRFPRVLRERTQEKKIEDINSLKDVERIYGMQRGKK